MGESSPLPHPHPHLATPEKAQETLLTHPSGERGPGREPWAGKLLNQEDKRRTGYYTLSILNLAAPTTLP